MHELNPSPAIAFLESNYFVNIPTQQSLKFVFRMFLSVLLVFRKMKVKDKLRRY